MMDAGSAVVVYLREPRERVWGVLRRLDGVGATVEGCDLDSFEGWLSHVQSGGGRGDLSVLFYPLHRVEKILLDRGTPEVPSCSERFRSAQGLDVARWLDAEVESC